MTTQGTSEAALEEARRRAADLYTYTGAARSTKRMVEDMTTGYVSGFQSGAEWASREAAARYEEPALETYRALYDALDELDTQNMRLFNGWEGGSEEGVIDAAKRVVGEFYKLQEGPWRAIEGNTGEDATP